MVSDRVTDAGTKPRLGFLEYNGKEAHVRERTEDRV